MDGLNISPRDNLIVFDGVCVLCNGFYQFIAKHDRRGRFSFATAQGEAGQALYRALGMPTEHFDTVLVVVDGHIYEKAQAFGAVMGALGWPWRALAWIKWLPHWLTGPLYYAVARNRYRLFGKRDTCMIPTPEQRSRFLT